MKKIIAVMIFVMFLVPSVVLADYSPKARQAVLKALQEFFQVEQDNRLTIYSMRALMQDIDKAFMDNVAPPPIADPPPERKDK